MFFAYGALDILAQRNIVDLDQIHKGLLLSNSTNLSVYNIANLDIEALDWELVFNKVCVLFASNDADYGGKHKLFIDIKAVL